MRHNFSHRLVILLLGIVAILGLATLNTGCGGSTTSPISTYTVGGRVAGLDAGKSVVLQNNSADDLTISADGAFTFATAIANGGAYAVTVKTQPSGQTCSVGSGTGTISGTNVTGITVTCSADTYTVGGTMSGLSGTVVLQNNAGDDLSLNTDGAFTFPTAVADGAAYAVTVKTQPVSPSQTCTVSNGSGAIAGAAVTNVGVVCVTNSYAIGGTVSGLLGSGLELQNNSGDDLSIAADGSFAFVTKVASGATYHVAIKTQPVSPSQTCTPNNGSGTVAGADVTNVSVICSTNSYIVGGTVSGLLGSGLVLQDNAGDDLSIAADGSFAFVTKVASGAAYNVTVKTQPLSPSQTCTVNNGSGTVTNADVTNVSVICSINSYTVGGTVSGVVGSGLVLQNNGGDDLSIAADGIFAFATKVASGATYTVTVKANPDWRVCSVTDGSGTMGAADVTDVGVACVDAVLWAESAASGGNSSKFNGVATDATGVYTAGYIDGTGTYDFGNSKTASGDAGVNVVMVKYNSSGTPQWVNSVTGGGANSVFLGAATDSGGVYAVGYMIGGAGTFNFGNGKTASGSNAGRNYVVIVKYDSSGLAQWANSVTGGGANSEFYGAATDSGGVYVVGHVAGTGTFDFGNSKTASGANSSNVVIVKYNSSGTAQWAHSVTGGGGGSEFKGVATDSGGVYAVGYISGSGSYDFGNSKTASGGYAAGQNGVIVKYDATGTAQWARSVTGGGGTSSFYGVAADAAGGVYAVGGIAGTGTYDFGNGKTASGANGNNVVIVKYDANGTAQWARSVMGGGNASGFFGVATDPNGIYAAGYIDGTGIYDFGNSRTASGANADNIVVVKYDSAGAAQWARSVTGGANVSEFYGVATDSDGVYGVGFIDGKGTYDFGNSRTAAGPYTADNVVIVKYLQ